MADEQDPAPSELQRIHAALDVKYDGSHVVLREVPDCTGFENGRADAIAVSMYHSRKFELIGFEIKTSRGDWLRELKDPAKSERFRRHCALWYLVALPGCAERAELPAGWGLITLAFEVDADALRITRRAQRNWAVEPIPLALWASLVRAAARRSPAGGEFERGVCEGRRRERVDAARRADKRVHEAQDRLLKIQNRMFEAECKSRGVSVEDALEGR